MIIHSMRQPGFILKFPSRTHSLFEFRQTRCNHINTVVLSRKEVEQSNGSENRMVVECDLKRQSCEQQGFISSTNAVLVRMFVVYIAFNQHVHGQLSTPSELS